MKISFLLPLFLLAAAPLARGGGPVETFEGKPAFVLEPGVNPDNTGAVVDDTTKKGNHILKIAWPAQNGTHASVNYSNPAVVITDNPGKYKITARVNTEQVGPEVHALALRFVDVNNETFQLSAPLTNVGAPGWQEVSWILDTSNPDTGGVKSWGDKVDGIVDLPATLLGFALSFDNSSTPGGALLLDDITVTKLADK